MKTLFNNEEGNPRNRGPRREKNKQNYLNLAYLWAIFSKLATIDGKVDKIMANQQQAAEQLAAINVELVHVGTETQALLARIEELIAIANNVSPELQAAIDAVAAQARVVNDLVPEVMPPVEP